MQPKLHRYLSRLKLLALEIEVFLSFPRSALLPIVKGKTAKTWSIELQLLLFKTAKAVLLQTTQMT